MTPLQAGWQVIGAPGGPVWCPGSGQVAVFAEIGTTAPCPSCARPVRVAYDRPAGRFILADHQPPAPEAPTISLGL